MLAELDEEVRGHLTMRVAELEAQGFTREAAEAEARRRFGDADSLRREIAGTARRQARAAGLTEWFRSVLQDIRFAGRRLLGSPLFVLATTATLAIAIGATASLFGIVDQVLLKPYPYRDPDRVLRDTGQRRRASRGHRHVSGGFPRLSGPKHGVLLPGSVSRHASHPPGQPGARARRALVVTPNYATTVGLTPVLGRFLAADSAGPAEVVIGYAFWQRRFGGARSVLGQVLKTGQSAIHDRGCHAARAADERVVRQRPVDASRLRRRGPDQAQSPLPLGVRASQADVPFERAQQDLNRIAGLLAAAYPADKVWTATATPLLQSVLGTITPTLTALLGAALCVLLVGAANLANLFLVRYLGREREIALRIAIGATRGRIVRELAIESVLLGLTAAAMGVALSAVGIRALRALAPASLPRVTQATVDGGVVAFGVAAAFTTVLLFGVLPAWRASHGDIADVVKEERPLGGHTTASATTERTRHAADGDRPHPGHRRRSLPRELRTVPAHGSGLPARRCIDGADCSAE